jgi:hypothetical protein
MYITGILKMDGAERPPVHDTVVANLLDLKPFEATE